MIPHALLILVATPFVAALILLAVPQRLRLVTRLVSLTAALISGGLSVWVAATWDMTRGGFQLDERYPVVPSLGIEMHLAVNGWGAALLVLTGLIIVGGVLATWTQERRDQEFYILLLVLVAGVFGVFVCQDLFIFFLFYEIAVLPMYILIGIWGSQGKVEPRGPFKKVYEFLDVGGREYAAMKLTLMLLVGSAAILVAILALYFEAGGTTFDMIALGRHHFSPETQKLYFPMVWLGFGALAGVFPFHTWSPDGHAAAPTAVSMLHAGVLMKLGAFGVMRVGMVLMPEGAIAWAPIVGGVAVINIVYGAFGAMGQKDLKYIVAYSSVSHMGVVMLGAATMTIDGWNGAIFQMVAHGVMTGLFFALVGLVYGKTHTRWIPKMGGFGRIMPGIASFFTLACLSSLALPGTAGFVAELLVFLGAWESGHPVWAIAGAAGAFITAVYVLRAVKRIFWGEGPSEEFAKLGDAKHVEWGALVLLGAAILVFGFWPAPILDLIDATTTRLVHELLPLTLALNP
jgi:NADH-quinone oxidoreductase subunit M